MITNVLKELEFRLRVASNKDVILLDNSPAVIRDNTIYIVAPEDQGVDIESMISNDAWVNYTIKIYEVCHVENMNRQTQAGFNIYSCYDEAESILKKLFPRGSMSLGGGAVCTFAYGTSTWVSDTKIFSGLTLTIDVQDTDNI